jgi:hypothetical protein
MGRTFLSEYHPDAKVAKAASAPPGAPKIKVCLDLERVRLMASHTREKAIYVKPKL